MHTLFIGTQFDREGKRIPPYWRDKAIADIKAKALDRFGGYSVSHVQGGWMDNGQAIEERVLRLEIAADGPSLNRQVEDFARFCGRALEQASVLLVTPAGRNHFLNPRVIPPR